MAPDADPRQHGAMNDAPVILLTGGARRVGAAIARRLHGEGCRLALHYRDSQADAEALAAELQARRSDSVLLLQGDLADFETPARLVAATLAHYGQLDGLVNNASAFYATPLETATPQQWDALFAINARAPFFLAQAAATALRARRGAIVNILDIYSERPLPSYPLYSASKAALRMSTLTLAQALGPEVRVNAVAPGTVLWSEQAVKAERAEQVQGGTALRRLGCPEEVAAAVRFLLFEATYSSGAVLPVDGGRLLST